VIQIGGIMIEVTELIKGDTPVICLPERAQHYLDQGFRVVGEEVEENVEEEAEEAGDDSHLADEEPVEGDFADGAIERTKPPEATNRQEAIMLAVRRILDRNDPIDFTGGGLPRIEAIAAEAGVEDVTGSERAIAMQSVNG
jgi:hypothetical protein